MPPSPGPQLTRPLHELHPEGVRVGVVAVQGLHGALPATRLPALEVLFQLPCKAGAGMRHPHEQRGRRAEVRSHGSPHGDGAATRDAAVPGPGRGASGPAALERKVSVSLFRRSLSVPGRAAPAPLFAALPAADCRVSRSCPLFPGRWGAEAPGSPLLRTRAGEKRSRDAPRAKPPLVRMEAGQMLKSKKVSPEFVIPFFFFSF